MKPIPGKIICLSNHKTYLIKQSKVINSFSFQSKTCYENVEAFLFKRLDGTLWIQYASQIYDYFHQNFKNHTTKLTSQEVKQIYQAGKQQVFSLQELADMFNVSKTTIHNIISDKTWTKIKK